MKEDFLDHTGGDATDLSATGAFATDGSSIDPTSAVLEAEPDIRGCATAWLGGGSGSGSGYGYCFGVGLGMTRTTALSSAPRLAVEPLVMAVAALVLVSTAVLVEMAVEPVPRTRKAFPVLGASGRATARAVDLTVRMVAPAEGSALSTTGKQPRRGVAGVSAGGGGERGHGSGDRDGDGA